MGERSVRYHLTPTGTTPAQRLRGAAGMVSVEVPLVEPGLRLLPLIRSLTGLRPLTAVVGLTADGQPLLLPLDRRPTWHLLAVGSAGTGKSELLRTLALSLAMTARPAQLRMLGVDIGGHELAVLESLPHLAADLATEPGAAARLLAWLARQADRRLAGRSQGPEWVLVLDDLSWLVTPEESIACAELHLLLTRGPDAGVHVVAARRLDRQAEREVNFPDATSVRAEPAPGPHGSGRFCLVARAERVTARVAWLPAADLQQAVRWIAAGWRAG